MTSLQEQQELLMRDKEQLMEECKSLSLMVAESKVKTQNLQVTYKIFGEKDKAFLLGYLVLFYLLKKLVFFISIVVLR